MSKEQPGLLRDIGRGFGVDAAYLLGKQSPTRRERIGAGLLQFALPINTQYRAELSQREPSERHRLIHKANLGLSAVADVVIDGLIVGLSVIHPAFLAAKIAHNSLSLLVKHDFPETREEKNIRRQIKSYRR